MNNIIKIIQNVSKVEYRNRIILSSFHNLYKCRQFHNNATLCIKMFMEHENKYAYNIMKNKGYTINLNIHKEDTKLSKEEFHYLLQENWSKKPSQELFNAFPKLGSYSAEYGLCISNKIFDSFIDNLTDSIKNASDEELKSLFYSLLKWPETESIRTRNYIEVWVALDDECLNRRQRWSFDETLTFVALFYMLNVSRVSDFSFKSLQKLASKAKQLTPEQLVLTMFFIGVHRKSPHDIHNLEVSIGNSFSNFNIDELAIMSMGFFKSKTPIRSMELVSKIIDKIIENSKTIHEVSLAALLKVIRYSMKIPSGDKIYRMLNILQNEIPRVSVMCKVHIALIGTSTLTLHKECLTKIADTIIDSISETRLKDLERLVLTFGTFNFRPQTKECFFEKVISELRKPERKTEIERYGRCFASCLAYLGLVGIYPVDLIDIVLNRQFLEKTYGKQCFVFGKEILTINAIAEIFCNTIEMNRLNEKEKIILAKKYTDFIPSEDYKKKYNITETMMLDIMKVLREDRGGKNYVTGDHILPHYQRGDVVICNDHNGIPLPVAEAFQDKFGLIRKPPDDNKWIVLIIAGRNAFIYNSDVPTGPFVAKIKELETLGFHAALVPWNIYAKFKTPGEKSDYLNSLIERTANKK